MLPAPVRLYAGTCAPFDGEPQAADFEVRRFDDKLGRGVVARRAFRKGALICRFTGTVRRRKALFTLQIRPGWHLYDPVFAGRLLHSCAPNARLQMGRRRLVALRDIRVGESLTIDYESTEDLLFRAFQCRCGARACRGRIAGRKRR